MLNNKYIIINSAIRNWWSWRTKVVVEGHFIRQDLSLYYIYLSLHKLERYGQSKHDWSYISCVMRILDDGVCKCVPIPCGPSAQSSPRLLAPIRACWFYGSCAIRNPSALSCAVCSAICYDGATPVFSWLSPFSRIFIQCLNKLKNMLWHM